MQKSLKHLFCALANSMLIISVFLIGGLKAGTTEEIFYGSRLGNLKSKVYKNELSLSAGLLLRDTSCGGCLAQTGTARKGKGDPIL